MRGKELALQLLFPRRCPVCDDIVTPFGEKICLDCMKKLKVITPPWCMRCGKKLFDEEEYCKDCRERDHDFVRGRALYEYTSAAGSIYRFKYKERQEYADFYGEEIAFYLGDFIRRIEPDALIPIPLHKKRKRKRGYNQAKLLAKSIGRQLEIPVEDHLLVRIRDTKPLKLLNPSDRQNNLKKAFNIARNDVKLKRVILIDDIYTTGSTIDEAAKTLRKNGIEDVFFLTLASTTGM